MMNKTCTRCNKEKLLEEFGSRKWSKSGPKHYKSWCKLCEKEVLQDWRINNPEQYSEQAKIHSAKRIDKANTNPEYRAYLREQKRLNSRINFVSGMLNAAKSRAKRKGLDFNITQEDIIIPMYCPLLDIKLILGTKGDYEATPSLDRIDNTKGYIKDNVAVISKRANSMKNSSTKEEMLIFLKNIQVYMQIKI